MRRTRLDAIHGPSLVCSPRLHTCTALRGSTPVVVRSANGFDGCSSGAAESRSVHIFIFLLWAKLLDSSLSRLRRITNNYPYV